MTVKPNEISLNSVRYPLKGLVSPALSSKFADKQVIGDYTKDSDPFTSSWTISDLTEGMLVEEMSEQEHDKRCWWSNLETRFKGEITLNPLVTEVAAPTTAVTSLFVSNPDMEEDGVWTGGAQSSVQKHGDSYSWLVNNTISEQILDFETALRGKTIVFTCYVYCSAASTARLYIEDGQGTAYSATYHSGTPGWELLTATRVMDGSATLLHIGLVSATANSAYFDDAAVTESACTLGNPTCFCNFNGILWVGWGTVLTKLNSGGTGFDIVADCVSTITDIFTDGSYLYILLGDAVATSYNYMCSVDTSNNLERAYALTITGARGVYWDAKSFLMPSSTNVYQAGNTIYQITNPHLALASLASARGKIPVTEGAVEHLLTYRDSDGDDVIYASTNEGLWAHDYANSKWFQTELKLPNQSEAGMGAVVWRDGLYISSGLGIYKYVAGREASIESVGLDRDDGLEANYSGAIVKLIEGFNEVYALVDPTYAGTYHGGVFAYDGKGWRTIYPASSTSQNMFGGIVSSDTAYRLWWGSEVSGVPKVYWMSLDAYNQKPKKIAGHTYNTIGYIFSPWFDADWLMGNKLALKVLVGTKDCTENEAVRIRYRTNHTNTGWTTGWSTLGTIGSDGETPYTFGTSLGTAFRAIQFSISLYRGATTTLSPIFQYLTLVYTRVLPRRWGWRFVVDCSETYDGKSPNQLLGAIVTAAELETLVPFIYQDTTYYVSVEEVQGGRLTGEGKKGEYEIFVVEPI